MWYMWEVGKCVVSVCLRVVTWVCQLHNCNYNVCSHSINGCPVMGVCRLGAHIPCDGRVNVWQMRVWMHGTGVLCVCWVWTQECIWGVWCAHAGGHMCVHSDLQQSCFRQGPPRFYRCGFGSSQTLASVWLMNGTDFSGLLQLKQRDLPGPFRHQGP